MALKIFKLKRTDFVKRDDYESMVVIAKDKDDALSFHPRGKRFLDLNHDFEDWPTDLTLVEVTEIGQANEGETARVVVSTEYNAVDFWE